MTSAVFTLIGSLRGRPRPLRGSSGARYSVCCSGISTSIMSLDSVGGSISVWGVVKYGLTTVERKLVGLLGSSTIQVSLSILRRVCGPD